MAFNPVKYTEDRTKKPTDYVEDRMGGAQWTDVSKPDKLAKDYAHFAHGINQPIAEGVDRIAPNTNAKESYSNAGKAIDDPGGAIKDALGGVKKPGLGGLDVDFSGVPQITAPTMAPGTVAPAVTAPTTGYSVPAPTAASVVLPSKNFTPATVQLPGQGPTAATVTLPTAYQGAQGQLSSAGPTTAQIGFDASKAYAPDAAASQNALMQALLAQSQGQGPSLANATLQQGQENNLNAVMAQLASARGGANPLLQRQAMNASMDIQAQTGRDAANARLQEQLQAQNLLGSVSNAAANQGLTARGQDVGMATNQAQLAQSANNLGYQTQAQMDLANLANQQQAGLAGYDAATKAALANAGYAQQTGLAQYDAATQAALANAGYAQQSSAAGFDAATKAALANAGYQQQSSMAGYEGQLSSARDVFGAQQDAAKLNAQLGAQYQQLVAQYAGMGLDAQKAQTLAAIEIQKVKANLLAGQRTADNQVLGGILSAGGGIAAAYAGGPAAAPAGAAAGQAAAKKIEE